MKYLILAAAITSTSALADGSVNATVEDHYKNYRVSTPHTERVCRDVEVPVYGQSDSTTDGTILGAIAGGILGNQVGKGNGKTAATALGAVIGSQVGRNLDAQDSNNVVGYRREERCENKTTHSYSHESRYSHSTIEFWDNGRKYTLRYEK